MEKSTRLSPDAYTQSNVRMSTASESHQLLREAGLSLPTFIPYGDGDSAILLHTRELEIREEFRIDVNALPLPFLPLMHTWTYQTCDGPSEQKGMKKCKKGCVVCPYLKLTSEIRSKKTKERFTISSMFNCNTTGVVYMTECQKCGIQYVGQTTRKFATRMREHINDIKNKKNTANATHYNSKGHELSDLRVVIIERVLPIEWLLEREEMWIKKLETKKPHGLNRKD